MSAKTRRLDGWPTSLGSTISRSAISTARKLAAFSAKHQAAPADGKHQAADRRADDARHVEHHGVQRDRVLHVVPVVDQLADDGQAGGRIERVRDAEQEREHANLPDLQASRSRRARRATNANTIMLACVTISSLRLEHAVGERRRRQHQEQRGQGADE